MPEEKRAVFITAASSGIGNACARMLVEKEFLVFAGVRRPEIGWALEKDSPGLIPVLLDVTNSEVIAQAATKVADTLAREQARLVGLVNTAADEYVGPLELVPMEWLRKEMEVGYFGYLAVIRTFLPWLRQTRGRIVNLSSMNGLCVFANVGSGCVTKYAIEAMSDALRQELKPWNIRVSLIEPGVTQTPLWEKSQKTFDNLLEQIPEALVKLYYPSRAEAAQRSRAESERYYKAGNSSERVARTIIHALTSPHPKIRYLVGRDARVVVFLKRVLPDGWFDLIATQAFH